MNQLIGKENVVFLERTWRYGSISIPQRGERHFRTGHSHDMMCLCRVHRGDEGARLPVRRPAVPADHRHVGAVLAEHRSTSDHVELVQCHARPCHSRDTPRRFMVLGA